MVRHGRGSTPHPQHTKNNTTMVQEKQLKELFKYIEYNWDVCVEDVDKRDIKRIFGGVLCEDITNDTLHEVKDKQPALNPIVEAFHNYEPIRYIDWDTNSWIKKHCDGYSIDERGKVYKNDSIQFNFDESPQHWELYTEPKQPSSQAKLDNSFDKERFERMFRAVIETHEATMNALKQLDAYYASKEGGANE